MSLQASSFNLNISSALFPSVQEPLSQIEVVIANQNQIFKFEFRILKTMPHYKLAISSSSRFTLGF